MPNRPAFTLIETLVAITLLTSAMLALQLTAISTIRHTTRATHETHLALFAQHHREQLIASGCIPSTGTTNTPPVTLTWTATVTPYHTLLINQHATAHIARDSIITAYRTIARCQ